MLRSTQIIPLYAILNRINYAFYNATEILKIIDVDSEMISGIIFVIYEDIFMSLILAFHYGFCTHISYGCGRLVWCGYEPQRISNEMLQLCELIILQCEHQYIPEELGIYHFGMFLYMLWVGQRGRER